MRILKTLLPLIVLLLWSTGAKADYDPTRPPEPGVFFTLATKCVPERAGRNMTPAGSYPFGTPVGMHVEANDHFRFVHWEDEEGNEVSASMDFEFTMPSKDVTLTAVFTYDPTRPDDPSPPEFNLTYIDFGIMPEGAGYIQRGQPGEYEVGSIQSFTARAYDNFRFVNWTRDGVEVGADATLEYTVPTGDHTLVANFEYFPLLPGDPGTPQCMRTLTLRSNPEGGAAALYGAGEFPERTEARVYLHPNPYYSFVNWTDELGEVVSDAADFIYTVPSRNAELTANFTFDYRPDLPGDPGIPDISDVLPENMVSWPRIGMYDDTHVQILCETPGAVIHYTLDGSVPNAESPVYGEPVFVGSNLLVRAIAYKEGMEDSPVVSYQVRVYRAAAPVFTLENGLIKITSATPDAVIRYTLDFSNPNEESEVYTVPFEPEENCRIKAYASKEGLTDSPISFYVYRRIDHVLAPPAFSLNEEGRLVITPAVSGATTYYTTDGSDPTEGSAVYSEPLDLNGVQVVKAFTVHVNYLDSPVAEYVVVPGGGRCADVAIDYHGRYVALTTREPGAVIRYTLDGGEPSGGATYTGAFDAGGLCTVRAMAVKEGYEDSDVAELVIDRYADEGHAETSAEGLLAAALEWNGSAIPDGSESFRIEGKLNDADFAFLRSQGGLRHLDLGKVVDAHIPANAFAGSRLVSVNMPEDLVECGDALFADAMRLGSVIWNSRMAITEGMMRDIANPNLLLYVPADAEVADTGGVIVVRNGEGGDVTLHYGYPYYAARDFRADRISLTKEFRLPTSMGGCSGWETIVLPFDADSIVHERGEGLVPFIHWAGQNDSARPFWLYQATSSGWERAAGLEAGVPYVVSMPNNPGYEAIYNIPGKVTFSAHDVSVSRASSFPRADAWGQGIEFVGTFMPVEEPDTRSLNVNVAAGFDWLGSAFVDEDVTVPFGAYVRGEDLPRRIPVFGDWSGVLAPVAEAEGIAVETPAPGVLRISSGRECRVEVTTATGVTVRTLRLQPGETVTLEGLTRGLCIVAGRKVMVR